jgi:hypothetical protein
MGESLTERIGSIAVKKDERKTSEINNPRSALSSHTTPPLRFTSMVVDSVAFMRLSQAGPYSLPGS